VPLCWCGYYIACVIVVGLASDGAAGNAGVTAPRPPTPNLPLIGWLSADEIGQ
jgi:hypothetical protein